MLNQHVRLCKLLPSNSTGGGINVGFMLVVLGRSFLTNGFSYRQSKASWFLGFIGFIRGKKFRVFRVYGGLGKCFGFLGFSRKNR